MAHAHDTPEPDDEPVAERDDTMNAADSAPAEGSEGAVSVAEPGGPVAGSSDATDTAETPGAGEILPGGTVVGRRRRKNATRQAIEWLALVIGAVVLALVIRGTLFQAFYIPSASMAPTLEVNDRILVNKASYKLHAVHRGDIVVFNAPSGEVTEHIKDLVKRVIGLPGETIESKDNHVYIVEPGQTQGRELDEGYVKPTPDCPAGSQSPVAGRALQVVHIPPGEYFVMGDNRCASEDSRAFGPIKKSSIIGRAFLRIWPLTRIKIL